MLDAVFLANIGSSYFVPATSHALEIRLPCSTQENSKKIK